MDVIAIPINHKALKWDRKNKRFILTIDKLPHPYSEKIGGLRHPFIIKNEETLKTGYVKHKCDEKWEVTCMGQVWQLIEE